MLVFGGQNGRYIGLNKEIYDTSVILRSYLDHCDSILRSFGGQGLFPGILQTKHLHNIIELHTAQFALQYSCAQAWKECGLKIDLVLGHSIGQLTALTFSGYLLLNDELKLVYGRASLMQAHWGSESGCMLSIKAEFTTIQKVLSSVRESNYEHVLEVACNNGPENYVLVGSMEAVKSVEKLRTERTGPFEKVECRRLEVTHGFHSQLTEPVLPGLHQLADGLDIKDPVFQFESCSEDKGWTAVDAKSITEHTRLLVFFSHAVERVSRRLEPCTWLEAGSNSSICAVAARVLGAENLPLHSLHNVESNLAATTCNLWRDGQKVRFWLFHPSQSHCYESMNLPPYQFAKTKHWLEWKDSPRNGYEANKTGYAEIKERGMTVLSFIKYCDSGRLESEFKIEPRSEQYRLLVQGHSVVGNPLCPAPLHMELVVQAMNILETQTPTRYIPEIEDLTIMAPLGDNLD